VPPQYKNLILKTIRQQLHAQKMTLMKLVLQVAASILHPF